MPAADQARGWDRTPRAAAIRGAWLGRAIGTASGFVAKVVVAPFRGAVYLESRWEVASRVKRLLYNDAETMGVLPSVDFVSGFGISAGAQVFHKDLFGHREKLALKANYGGRVNQAYQLKFELPSRAGSRVYAFSRLRYEEKDNLYFHGVGNAPTVASGVGLDPRSAGVETRYAEKRLLAVFSGGVALGRQRRRTLVGFSVVYNDRNFDAPVDRASGTPLAEVYDTSLLVGFDQGFQNLELTVDASFDTRDTEGPTGAGFVARAFGGGASLLGDANYLHYGAELAYYVTPALPGRVFAVRLAHEGVRGDAQQLPFTELPRLGGIGLLRGYHIDRFRDELSNIATVEYHYPIHFNLSGSLFAEAGKVGNDYDGLMGAGFADDWHLGYGGGLIVHGPENVKVRLDVAYGDGLQVYFSTDVLNAFRKREREL